MSLSLSLPWSGDRKNTLDQKSQDPSGDRSLLGMMTLVVLLVTVVLTSLVSLTIGASSLTVADVVSLLWKAISTGQIDTDRNSIILFDIRLPRILLGLQVGGALAVSGAVMQGLFRNPLADPAIIGVSGGAGLFAGLVIVFGPTWLAGLSNFLGIFMLPAGAFVGAILVTSLLYTIATRSGQTSVATLLLAGLALAALTNALMGLLTFLSDDQQLRDLQFWSLGSLAGATWIKVLAITPFTILVFVALPFLARGLNALALGEAQAGYLGFSPQILKRWAIICAALGTGAAVSVAGLIGFIGIIAPHLLRLVIGPDNRFLLPSCALLGGCFLILADSIARVIVAPAELPIGIIMALIGGPFFLWLLMRNKGLFIQ